MKILKLFKLHEIIFVLTIINFCITIPVGASASPDNKTQSLISEVKNSLRQISEAAALWEKAGGCSGRECTDVNKLASNGKLSAVPQVPIDIGEGGNRVSEYKTTGTRMGGCGHKNKGAQITLNPAIYFVSEKFCRDYNNSAGLGSIIVENCGSGGNCSVSGSTASHEFPVVNSQTFCFRRLDTYAIVWMGTINEQPCP